MSELYPVIFGCAFIALLSLASILFLRLLNRLWWSYRWVRLTAYLIPVFGATGIILWALGVKSDSRVLTGIGATSAAITLVVEIAMLLSLPVSGIIHITVSIVAKLRKSMMKPSPVDQKRRLILKTAASVFPIVAVSTGVGGVVRSYSDIKVPVIPLTYPELPNSLEGLKILQLSDSHLGFYVVLSDLERALVDTEQHKPDIVLITGDIADDLRVLPDALKLISQIKPRFGCYACLGNHEYYRGIKKVREEFDKNPISLLVNSGITVDIDGSPVYIAGADDPKWMHGDHIEFVRNAVSESIKPAPADTAFKILLSHRPAGFDFAAEHGVDLTLAGHTHGGQIGVGGRSFFDWVLPYKYLWGHYTKDNGSQLYTSSGIGHWFPFRLGCPAEAPVFVLRRGEGG